MRRTILCLAAVTLTAIVGCNQGTPGGPGMSDTVKDRPAYGQADDTFNLSIPMLSSTLQQGEQLEATIGIKRATNFDQDVSIKFTDIPKGVTIEPASPTIKSSDSEAKIVFKASENAPLGDFQVKVTGHPTKGQDAEVEFKLEVTAKDSFTLSMPFLSTSLKQGEKVTVPIGISRDKTFDQEVTLTIGDMPTGVTIEPSVHVIKPGESEAPITLTAADDASLGDFNIKVTGHPAKGADSSEEFKLTIVEK